MASTIKHLSHKSWRRPYNNKVDIFSLGVVLYEMWCGPFKTPVARENMLEQDIKSKNLDILDKNKRDLVEQ